jgi:tRNA-dihydrouridine synthase 2
MDTDVERLWGDGKLLLGPMVRASSLPLRLSALSYGADVVYSEEIPAHRAAHTNCTRISNEVLNTVDFVEYKNDSKSPLVLFRTHVDREVKARCCVLQLGTSHATTALRAAQLFERDVTAIDINMGCAKHYSVSKGMGSALMERPEVAEDIVKTLRRNISIPISVKTRIFDPAVDMCGRGSCDSNTSPHHKSMARSLEWLQRLQVSGVHAVTVHMRSSTEKNRDAAHTDLFGLLHAKMRCTNTPLVYNGDIWGAADVQRVRESVRAYCPAGDTDTTAVVDPAVMVCRAGLWNPAVFAELRRDRDITSGKVQPSGPPVKPVELSELLRQIVKTSAETANCPLNTRYLLQQVLAGARKLDSEVRKRILRAYTLAEVAAALDIEEEIVNERARQTTAWERHTYSSEGAESGYGGMSSSNGSVGPAEVCTSTAGLTQQLPAIDSGIASRAVIRNDHSRYFNAQHWPGIVSLTSHEYNDRYFDDNYYVAFSRPAHCRGCPVSALVTATDVSAEPAASSGVTKRPFAFSGFTESNTTVVRVKKRATME